jgi:hypothetical protein
VSGPDRAEGAPASDVERLVEELGRSVLGIDDPDRLREMTDLAGLLAWVRSGVPALQRAHPDEPPPALAFRPGDPARDFWRGVPPDA